MLMLRPRLSTGTRLLSGVLLNARFIFYTELTSYKNKLDTLVGDWLPTARNILFISFSGTWCFVLCSVKLVISSTVLHWLDA